MNTASLSAPPLIELDGVWKTHECAGVSVHALRAVSLRVAAGELAAIVGPSGSGKTTLLEILGCLSHPTRGTFRLAGSSVSAMDERAIAFLRGRRIGFVFQSFHLLPRLTALENVELPMLYQGVHWAERRRRAVAGLRRVGLAHRLGHFPSALSGGECQRVAIARSLVNDPALVLADEPTGNLDSSTGAEILSLLVELRNEGRTVVIVTHDRDVAARCTRRIHLRDGTVESDDRAGDAP